MGKPLNVVDFDEEVVEDTTIEWTLQDAQDAHDRGDITEEPEYWNNREEPEHVDAEDFGVLGWRASATGGTDAQYSLWQSGPEEFALYVVAYDGGGDFELKELLRASGVEMLAVRKVLNEWADNAGFA